MPDWWNTLSHLLVLISWGRWNWNSMRKILVATTNEVTKTWRCFTAQALRAPKLKTDYKNLSLGTANRSLKPPWLVAAKNVKQNFRKPFSFSKQGVGWHFFSTNLCLYVWCNADRFSCTRIRLFQSLKKSQLVTCIRVFNSDNVRNTERYESVPIARKNLKRPSK